MAVSYEKNLNILAQRKNVTYSSGGITTNTYSTQWVNTTMYGSMTCSECFAEVKSNLVEAHYNYHRNMNNVLEQLIIRVVNKHG